MAEPRTLDPAFLPQVNRAKPDTIIVPARKDGFEKVFLGKDCWCAARISGGMPENIKYVAGYQIHPVSAITHYAPVSLIEPYGEEGKFLIC